jgi:hypothetical protein
VSSKLVPKSKIGRKTTLDHLSQIKNSSVYPSFPHYPILHQTFYTSHETQFPTSHSILLTEHGNRHLGSSKTSWRAWKQTFG